MAEPEPPAPRLHITAAEEVEIAERRADKARIRAAHAGLSAAQSLERTARSHDEVAAVQKTTIQQGISHTEVHEKSAAKHRKAADHDRLIAEAKRRESQADLDRDRPIAPPNPDASRVNS